MKQIICVLKILKRKSDVYIFQVPQGGNECNSECRNS